MEFRRLGRSGLRVSSLAMGTMTFGGSDVFGNVGQTDSAGARRQIDLCLDAGVNLIDTANVYSAGAAEEILGQVIAGRRDQLLISSKVRMAMGDGPNDEGLSRHHILEQIEASLRRLNTDHLDIYSLESRDAEYELVPLSLDQGLGIMVWSPLAGGLLSGKYRRGQQASDGRHLTEWSEPPVRDEDKLYDSIETVVDMASDHGASPAQVSLAYLLAKPGVTSVIIGARKDEQLADNLGAVDVHLSSEDIDRLDKVSAPDLIYPHWHQANSVSSRFSEPDLALHRPDR
ncbi:aldo/keto reductase [Streptomyces spiralis]